MHLAELKLETCADLVRDSQKVIKIKNERKRDEERDREVAPCRIETRNLLGLRQR